MQTATNPQTGEKMVLQNGQWVPAGGAPQSSYGQPQAPMVVGTPRPEKPKDPPSGYTGGPGGLTPIPGGPADPRRPGGELDPNKPVKDPKVTADERVAAGYYGRALSAHKQYGKGITPRGSLTQLAVDQLNPGIVREQTSPERRAAEDYAREFIRAKLRKESGASIPPAEMKQEFETYFPMPGDVQVDLDRKARLREQAIEGLRAAAGQEADDVNIIDQSPGEGEELPTNPLGVPTQKDDQGVFALSEDGVRLEYDPETKEWTPVVMGGSVGSPVQAAVDKRLAESGSLDSLAQGAIDTISFGGYDEFSAGVDALGGALSGDGSFSDIYQQKVAEERAIAEAMQQRDPGSFLTGQIAGGFAVPAGAGATGVRGFAKVGALQGGAYGFGSSQGNALERLPGAALGATGGAAAGAVIGKVAPPVADGFKYVGNALGRFAGKRPGAVERQGEAAAARPIVEAGQRRNIPIRQPDARPSTRNEFAAAEATEGGGPIINRAMKSDADAVQADVRSLSNGGSPLERGRVGETAQGVVNRYSAQTKQAGRDQYALVDKLAPEFTADPAKVVGAVKRVTAELEKAGGNATAAERKFLTDIADDLAKSGLSVKSIQAQRESARKRMQAAGIDFNAAQNRLDELMGIMGDELDTALVGNPRAQEALRKANKLWAEQAEFRREVGRTFLGPKGDTTVETAGQRLEAMFGKGGDSKKFGRVWEKMNPAERTDILATVVEGWGQNGRKEFSLATLAKSIENANPRTIVKAFGADGAKALRDIKIIANAKADTMGGLNNSKSGVVNTHNGIGLRTLIFGGLGASVGDVTGLVGGAALSKISSKFQGRRAARLLLNPDFTKWLRQTPQSASPEVINRHFARLTAVASRSPVMAADVKALQQALSDAFSESATRAAAGQDKDKAR